MKNNKSKAISQNWPEYYPKMLHTKNKLHHIGIITLWSKKEIYIDKLKDISYNTIGQLYSRNEGISSLIRNLLANKNITDLIMVGSDLNNCSDAIKALFEKGVDENNKIRCDYDSQIQKEISTKSIQNLIKNVKLHDLTQIKDYNQIKKYIIQIPHKQSYGKIELFEETKLEVPQIFPSDQSVYKVRGEYISDVWLRILKRINKFGIIKNTQYGDTQKELVCLVSTITKEDPDEPKWSDNFEFTKENLKNYIPQVTSVKHFEGLDYTYGQKLMDHKGVNQITQMIDELKKENYSRRAIAITWDVKKDYNNPKCPCLDLIQAIIQKNKLYLTCYFRSNDMYDAWPRNAFALRKLQKNISQKVGVKMGDLIIISNSAHIYERCFKKSIAIVEKNKHKISWAKDPYGSILISIKNKEILITHLDTNGIKIDKFSARTAIKAYQKIASELKISNISHALDIGCELQKAQIAIELGIEYKQDYPLKFIK